MIFQWNLHRKERNHLQQDLAEKGMACTMDPIFSHHLTKEGQITAMPEL